MPSGTNPFQFRGRTGMFNTPAITLMRQADKNKDGKISWEEVQEVLLELAKELRDLPKIHSALCELLGVDADPGGADPRCPRPSSLCRRRRG